MAHKRKDTIISSGTWNRHLKPEGKRTFYKKERKAVKRMISKDKENLD